MEVENTTVAPETEAQAAPEVATAVEATQPLIVDGYNVADLEASSDPELRDLAKELRGSVEKVEEKAAEAEVVPGKTETAEEKAPEVQDKKELKIPKARLDEEIKKSSSAAHEAAYWKGIADAREVMLKQGKGGDSEATQQVVETPEQKIAKFDDGIVELAKKYDDGEITMAEFKKQERDFQKQIREVEMSAVKQPPAPQPVKTGNDLYMQEKAQQIVTEHPYLELMSEGDRLFLGEKAEAELIAEGARLQIGDPASILAVQKRMGELSDRLGSALTGKQLPQKTVTQPLKKAGVSENAAARQVKLEMKNTQPPPTHSLGNPGSVKEYTEADIEKMSDDDIARLPASVREKLSQS
jgi:hypothetical protein